MFRIIVFLLIIYIIYHLFKRYVVGTVRPRSKAKNGTKRLPPITDELVRDPVCGTYVPKKEALVFGKQGKLYYFCCKKCLEEFKKKGG